MTTCEFWTYSEPPQLCTLHTVADRRGHPPARTFGAGRQEPPDYLFPAASAAFRTARAHGSTGKVAGAFSPPTWKLNRPFAVCYAVPPRFIPETVKEAFHVRLL
jgi:hypothetical protein